MKKIFTLILFVLVSLVVFSQSPEGFSYQAIVRDTENNLITNQTIGIQLNILQYSESGSSVYTETQTPATNSNGLFSIEIGTGTSSDDMSTIDWSDGPYYIKTEIDIEGGVNYTITGISQLLSVPYALHAKTAESYNEIDGDITNELQVISISNDTIYLTDGGFVKIPDRRLLFDTLASSIFIDTSSVDISKYDFVIGSTHLNDLGKIEHDNKLFFDKSKGAFRAGGVEGSEWDENNRGEYSIALGKNGKASGDNSVALGNTNIVQGENSIAFGIGNNVLKNLSQAIGVCNYTHNDYAIALGSMNAVAADNAAAFGISNIIQGYYGVAIGLGNRVSDTLSVAIGQYNETYAEFSVAMGNNLKTYSGHEIVLGRYNTSYTPISQNDWDEADPLFTLGNGTVQESSNALTIYKNGKMNINDAYDMPIADGTAGQVMTTNGVGVVSWSDGVATYEIGDFVHGGIVIWLDETGQHGLVCAKEDQSTSVRWYAGTGDYTMAMGDGPLSGKANTTIIIASQGYGDGSTYAARVCNELQITENGKTYGDWYLPSKHELNLIYQNKAIVNTVSTENGGSALEEDIYWSSTEFNSGTSAWAQYFLDGFQVSDYNKGNSFNVRAVRAF